MSKAKVCKSQDVLNSECKKLSEISKCCSKARSRRNATPDNDRESPLTVARKWIPWCVALIFVMTIGWTVLIAGDEVVNGNHPDLLRTVTTVGTKAASATPAIVIWAVLIVSAVDVIEGFIVVTKRYLENKWVKPLIERHKAEGRKEGLDEANRAWEAWNSRRMEADVNGVPFDEPPPSL